MNGMLTAMQWGYQLLLLSCSPAIISTTNSPAWNRRPCTDTAAQHSSSTATAVYLAIFVLMLLKAEGEGSLVEK